MAEQDQIVDALRKEYCPPIDESLFEALRLDYSDLTQQERLTELCQVLDQIKQDAPPEEATGFDPSGTSSHALLQNDGPLDSSSDSLIRSSDIELESIATGLSDLTWDESVKNDRATQPQWNHLSDEGKEERLAELLPQMSRTTIRFTLRKNKYKFDESMDELLLLSFLDEDEKQNSESLESYSTIVYRGKGRNKKGKRNANGCSYNSVDPITNSSVDAGSRRNVWTTGKEEVEFISARTTISSETATSLYHAHGASLSATILALGAKHAPSSTEMESLDVSLQVKAADIAQDFPRISQDKVFGLLNITHGDVVKVSELLRAVLTANYTTTTQQPEPIVPRYSPSPIHSEQSSDTKRQISRSLTPSSISDPWASQRLATSSRTAGSEAFKKATAAYRRGKSDRHFGAVAAYYSDVGREHMQAAREQSSIAANSLVSMKSTSSSIDLHGVGVMDAVRIASQRVEAWWEGLGDSKLVPGGSGTTASAEGYRIVTGVGRHSKDGAPKVGPAVAKRLINEGWKVDVRHGELLVRGRRRAS